MEKGRIKEIFKEVGILDVGFCSFDSISDKLLECRAKARLPENAKTVIIAVFPYKAEQNPPENISRYAAVADYHPICINYLEKAKEKLVEQFPENRFEVFVDNSPIPERLAAAGAGLGVLGENGLLITKKYGSFVFLGEIVTDLEIKCEEKIERCSGCGRCKSACPKENSGVCLSELTQKKGELSELQKETIKKYNTLWGCDICAEVCPENRSAEVTYIEEFKKSYRNRYTLGEDPKNRPYNWRQINLPKRLQCGHVSKTHTTPASRE